MKIKVPSGTIQKLETVFDDLQTFEAANLKNRLQTVLNDTFGIPLRTVNGVIDSTFFKVDRADTATSKTKYTIQPGSAITESGEYLNITDVFTGTNINNAQADTFYLIKAGYVEAGTDSITAMNSFLYDSAGTTPYSSKYSRFQDSFSILNVAVLEATGVTVASNEIALAIVKTDGNARFLHSNFTFADNAATGTPTYTAVNGVIDLRFKHKLTLNSDLLDDSVVLMKDRDSTGTSAINGSIEVLKDLSVTKDFTVSGDTTLGGSVDVADSQTLHVGTISGSYSGTTDSPVRARKSSSGGSLLELFTSSHTRLYIEDSLNTGTYDEFRLAADHKSATDSFTSKNILIGRSTNYDGIRFFGETGNVSIGVDNINSPVEKLFVKGNVGLPSTSAEEGGLVWKHYEQSDKESAAIKLVDSTGTNANRDAGLGFYTAYNKASESTLRVAISRDGKVIIGDTSPDYSSLTDLLTIKGSSKVEGNISTLGDISLTGNLVASGLSTLVGEVICQSSATFQSNVHFQGPLEVSGLTVRGTSYFELPNLGTHFASFKYKDESGVIHDKGSVHLDGLSNAVLDLKNSSNDSWAYITPSGSHINTDHIHFGSNQIPSTPHHDKKISITGDAPALVFRTDPNAGQTMQSTDWVLGADIGSNSLKIGRFTSPLIKSNYFQINETGSVAIGQDPDNSYKLIIAGDFKTTGSVEADEGKFTKLTFKKNSSDLTQAAGIDNNGYLTIGDDRGAQFPLSVRGIGHFYEDADGLTGIQLGSSKSSASCSITLTDGGLMQFKRGNNVFMEGGATTSGVYIPNATLDNATIQALSAPAITNTNFTSSVADITTANLADTVISESFKIDADAEQVNISGISNSEFRIGVGSLGTGGIGVKVLTEDVNPTKPTNLRVYDVKPTDNPDEHRSHVELKWNYNKIAGTGDAATKTFTLTDSTAIDESDSTKMYGKRFKLKHSGGETTYKITAWDNSSKVMTLGRWTDLNGSPGPEYGGADSVGPEHGTVIEEADRMLLQAVTVDDSGNILSNSEITEQNLVDTDFIEGNVTSLKLDLEKKYLIKLRSERGVVAGDFVEMEAGTYDPDHVAGSGQSMVTYGKPYNNILPTLDANGTLGASSSNFGFILDIGGWSDEVDTDKNPHQFEIAYTTNGSVDFGVSDNTTFVTSTSRHFEIPTPVSATYKIAARAKQNKQVVSETLTTSVLTGAGGVPPAFVNYWSGNINVLNYTGTIADASTATLSGPSNSIAYFYDLVFNEGPIGTTASGVSIATNELSNNNQFLEILNSSGSVSYGVAPIAGNNAHDHPTDMDACAVWVASLDSGYNTSGNKFQIGGSKLGRRITTFTVDTDIRIKLAVLDINLATNLSSSSPAVLRIYQAGQESNAGTMSIAVNTGAVSGPVDVEILGANGPRTIIVDMFDPDTGTPNNTASVMGILNLFGVPVMDTTTTSVVPT